MEIRIHEKFGHSLFSRLILFLKKRSVKDLLRESIGKKTMNFDQLQTELTEIEAVINDRPLTYDAEGVDEPCALSTS